MLLYSGMTLSETPPELWAADTIIVGVVEYDFPKLVSYD